MIQLGDTILVSLFKTWLLSFTRPVTPGTVPGDNPSHQDSASALKVELFTDQAFTQLPQTIRGNRVAGMNEGLSDLAVGEVQPLDFCA